MTEKELKVFFDKLDSLDCTEEDFIYYWTQIKKHPLEEAKEFYLIHMDHISRAHLNIL